MTQHAVELECGSVNLSLSTGSYSLTSYPMKSADVVLSGVKDQSMTVKYNDVKETITIFITGSTPANAQSLLDAIERFQSLAHRRLETKQGDIVYIKVKMISDSAYWKSEVLTLKVTPNADSFTSLPQSKLTVTIDVTRRYYWESTKATVAVTNAITTAPDINNHSDSTHANYASTDATTINGSLPAPAVISIKNNSGTDVVFKTVHLAINTHASPTTFKHDFQGENSIWPTPTVTADATCSNGNRGDLAIVSGSGLAYSWSLSVSNINAFGGQYFRAIARFKDNLINAYLKLSTGIIVSGVYYPTWTGDEVQADSSSNIVDLGMAQIPRANFQSGFNYSAAFGIQYRTTVSTTLKLDFLHMFPADSYKKIEQPTSFSLAQDDYLIDDSKNDETFLQTGVGSLKQNIFESLGNDLYLFPGKVNKVYVLVAEPLHVIGRNFWLSVDYYPRRLTL